MFTVYTKDNCPFCVKAKNLLTNKKLPFTVIEIGKDIELEAVKTMFPSIRTVPIITKTVDGHMILIGGYTDLEKII